MWDLKRDIRAFWFREIEPRTGKIIAVVVGFFVLWMLLFYTPDDITKSTCERLSVMKRAQVEAILGPPNFPEDTGGLCSMWTGRIGRITVFYKNDLGWSVESAEWQTGGSGWGTETRMPRDEHPIGVDRVLSLLGID
jgi:hypothetical protein